MKKRIPINIGRETMKLPLKSTLIGTLAIMAGCSQQPTVHFTYWNDDHPVRHIAAVQHDGSFNNAERWNDLTDLLSGQVSPSTGGFYRVSYLHEGRRFTGVEDEYEYNSYTNSVYTKPNETHVLMHLMVQGEDRSTVLMLKGKKWPTRP